MSDLVSRMLPETQLAERVAELEDKLEEVSVEAANWRDMLAGADMIINGLMAAQNSAFACGWAAAIEAAADILERRGDLGNWSKEEARRSAHALRSIPMPTDAAAALDLLTVKARVQGMREAADTAASRHALCDDAYLKHLGKDFAYRALEAKHIEDKILARAEEIEVGENG